MEPQISGIAQGIAEEITCLKEIADLLEREKDILLSGDHQQLMGLNQSKLSIFHRLHQTQEERRGMQQACAEPGQSPPSLRELSRRLPAEQQEGFRMSLMTADGLARRVMSASELNRGYVEEALATVDHLLGILSGQGTSLGYSPHGLPQTSNRPRLLTREV
jgi:flagellar biosynthesis/type III secretory pathway chaperone